MATKKPINAAARRHQDDLRRRGLKVGAAYSARLMKARHAEVARVLGICRSYDNPAVWGRVMDENLREPYLADWWKGLFLAAGMPMARSTVRDLSRSKAWDSPGGVWEQELVRFAEQRAGENIISVTGTLKDALRDLLALIIEDDYNIGIETLTRKILESFDAGLNAWQCRRIAQTETMIGLSDSAHVAAKSLDVPFVKQWCISGVGNTRETHEGMDGVTVDEDDYFILPDCLMRYPHDTSLNPPGGEVINCACSCIRIPK